MSTKQQFLTTICSLAPKLPAFSGKYTEYKNCITPFKQLICEFDLSYIEKFNRLLNCLHGQALETVKAR